MNTLQQTSLQSVRRARAMATALARDLGLAGWVGVVLIIATLWVGQWSWDQREQRAALEDSLAQVQTLARSSSSARAERPGSGSNPLQKDAQAPVTQNLMEILGELPVREARQPVAAGRLASEAQQRGVSLTSVEYRWQRPGGKSPVQRLDLNMSAAGSYPQLRAWLSEFMVRYPNAQLVEAQIERKEADGALEARVVIALHYRSGAGAV